MRKGIDLLIFAGMATVMIGAVALVFWFVGLRRLNTAMCQASTDQEFIATYCQGVQ